MSIVTTTNARVEAAAEAYRILRSSVKFAGGDATRVRTVLVVDVDRATTSGVAEQLSLAFARAGDACAFVDLATHGDGPGVAQLMAGEASAAEVARPSSSANLAVLAAGDGLQPDALASGSFADTLTALRDRFAYVIVTCAALPRHGDALAVAPHVDATILVVSSGQTRRARALQARDGLRRVGANLLGVVLVETRRRWFW